MVVQLPTGGLPSHPATLASEHPWEVQAEGMGKPGLLYNSGNHAPKGHKLSSDEWLDMVQQSLSREQTLPWNVPPFLAHDVGHCPSHGRPPPRPALLLSLPAGSHPES